MVQPKRRQIRPALPTSKSSPDLLKAERDSQGNRRKRTEESEEDGEEDGEPQPKKRGRKAREKTGAPEIPRRAARLRGADPEDAGAGGRQTRQKTG
jgi:hypothetical protein